jgi:hypothetical protein
MENPPPIQTPPMVSGEDGFFSSKNTIIIVLVALLVISFLGINLLSLGGSIVDSVSDTFKPIVNYVLRTLGYSAGTLIDDTADVAANVAKGGVDIADGVAHSIGDLLKGGPGATPDAKPDLATSVNQGPSPKYNQAAPDTTASPIQQPITAAKQNWCLVGEMNSQRGCISVSDANKCMSGQVYPTQEMCLNPNLLPGRPYG